MNTPVRGLPAAVAGVAVTFVVSDAQQKDLDVLASGLFAACSRIAAAVTAECQAAYPTWTAPARLGQAARTTLPEMPRI